jgi:ATP-dependent DNA helicase PIF1
MKATTIVALDSSQKKALEYFQRRESFFLSGPAGSGKSFLLNHFRQMRNSSQLGITATTGAAALLIQGRTVHSWAGIGLGKESATDLANKIMKRKHVLQRWRMVQTLVIDEVSMMSSRLLDKLDEVARLLRYPGKPFGGIQVVLVGDLFQLPPVDKNPEGSPDFVFDAAIWEELIGSRVVMLEKVYRQDDPLFVRCLMEIRRGIVSEESKRIFHDRLVIPRPDFTETGIQPTRLFARIADADARNKTELAKCASDIKVFFPKTQEIFCSKGRKPHPDEIDRLVQQMDESGAYVPELQLAVGAQVMCLVNDWHAELGIVNGSRGCVREFSSRGLPVVRFCNGAEFELSPRAWTMETEFGQLQRIQIPLRLAWGMTHHKAQGATLDLVEIDAGTRIFEAGQTYVALSRARSLDGLFLSSWDPHKIRAHPRVLQFYEEMQEHQCLDIYDFP